MLCRNGRVVRISDLEDLEISEVVRPRNDVTGCRQVIQGRKKERINIHLMKDSCILSNILVRLNDGRALGSY